MKKQLGGIVNNPSIGISTNRPPTRGEQNPISLPQMNDRAAIEAQREQLRQEELNRGKQQSGN